MIHALGGSKVDQIKLCAYNDGAFPDDSWLPYEPHNLFVWPEYITEYMTFFTLGKYHRYLRWQQGQEPNWW